MIATRPYFKTGSIWTPKTDGSEVLYIPFWHPTYGSNPATYVSKDRNAWSCTRTGAVWGKYGLTFDGSDDNIDCGNNNLLAYQPTGFSFAIWLNADQWKAAGSPYLAMCVDDVAAARQWALWHQGGDAGRWIFFVSNSGATAYIGRQISAASARAVGVWHQVIGTWDGGTASSNIKIYVDGVQVDDTNFQAGSFTGITDTGTALTIGSGAAATTQPFDGPIGEAILSREGQIWNASEAMRIYQTTRWRYVS